MQLAIESKGPTTSPAAYDYFMSSNYGKSINAIEGDGGNPGGVMASHPSRATKKRLAAQNAHEAGDGPGANTHKNAGHVHENVQENTIIHHGEAPDGVMDFQQHFLDPTSQVPPPDLGPECPREVTGHEENIARQNDAPQEAVSSSSFLPQGVGMQPQVLGMPPRSQEEASTRPPPLQPSSVSNGTMGQVMSHPCHHQGLKSHGKLFGLAVMNLMGAKIRVTTRLSGTLFRTSQVTQARFLTWIGGLFTKGV